MDILYCGHAQEDEDEGFTHAAPHFQEVLNAGVAVFRHISLHILLHGHSTGDNAAKRDIYINYRPHQMLPNIYKMDFFLQV